MALPDLSKSEYEVLRVLWRQGDSSFRAVHEQLDNGWAYTTTKTVMDRMVKKGLLQREKSDGVFTYQAQISRPQGLAKMVRFFASNVLEVDTNSVVAMFTNNQEMSKAEVKELKDLVNTLNDE
ncbi:BlaI/MecI/CopY family transcriptional regulator [Oceanicoccus sp. KOV_DT_Chl]|uniref:BlaI/MecI/CopY family transcriptional regulator n=1 Tax=Oceanicoccus sp. KOV_DT_Chl TaxID=1904639 RepID=UPI0013595A5B|nr:BlaI/MecI/CopY family transcriptional regulator [Oceanicoccus sp. KOV_DT_Chl]